MSPWRSELLQRVQRAARECFPPSQGQDCTQRCTTWNDESKYASFIKCFVETAGVKYVKHPHPEPLVAAMPERREPPARRSPAKGEYLKWGIFIWNLSMDSGILGKYLAGTLMFGTHPKDFQHEIWFPMDGFGDSIYNVKIPLWCWFIHVRVISTIWLFSLGMFGGFESSSYTFIHCGRHGKTFFYIFSV